MVGWELESCCHCGNTQDNHVMTTVLFDSLMTGNGYLGSPKIDVIIVSSNLKSAYNHSQHVLIWLRRNSFNTF